MAFLIDGKIVEKTLIHYVPHGINQDMFFPLKDDDNNLLEMKKRLFGNKTYDFVIFYNSRNVQRKRTSNVLMGYRAFCDNLTPEQAKRVCLLLHTERRCDAGTDLLACQEAFCKDYNVVYSEAKIPPEQMNLVYNAADVTINISSNEGFGLSAAESIMCGTPIIVNMSGGLQDQVGQVDDEGKPVVFSKDFGSNNTGKYKNHGVWAKPNWPTARCIQGSIPTPYIFDDLTRWEDAGEAMMFWYLMPREERKKCGKKGREWAIEEGGLSAKNMCNQFIKSMDFTLQNWKPVKQFDLFTVEDYHGNKMFDDSMGFEMPKYDTNKLNEEVKETIKKL
jgi:glycosyltransferase involved in cell wall biosynthesis